MRIDLEDYDDWAKVGRRGPDRGGSRPHFQDSKLFTAKSARRGGSARFHVPDNAPKFVLSMGYTQRGGIGADSRVAQRNSLRGQANYNGRDGKIGYAFSFDGDGNVTDRVWQRVEEWEDDKRYFRASLNPLDHDEIKDWKQFVTEFMETLQHGSQHIFGSKGDELGWSADGLLTDEDRAAGHNLDWVASIHRETGRTHAHVLIRGMVGNEDLYIEPGAIGNFWQIGRGVASMPHHVGMQLDKAPDIEGKVEEEIERTIRKEIRMEDRDVRRQVGLDLEMD